MADLSDKRRVYQKKELLEATLNPNPMEQFRDWYNEAETEETGEANAMTISTVSPEGQPVNRVVLLKQYTWEGFIFYTNYNSQKGMHLANTPKACLSFHWQRTERQVIITGAVEKIAPNLSDGYFESRPAGSQLGAIASDQSQPIESRDALDNKLKAAEDKYQQQPIVRPEWWGGYIVKPVMIEFWQGRPNRMHDRIRYTLQPDWNWNIQRIQP